MIVDFQHHYTPREILKGKPGEVSARLDANGNPSYLLNPLLADLDAHVRMMERARIDVAVLSCGEGFDNPDPAGCRFINDMMRKAETDYPGRFVGLAHLPALDATAGAKELARAIEELGFPGVTIGSELQGRPLDDPALDWLWSACERRRIYVFVHPLPRVIAWNQMYADDLGRVLGWEFSLATAALRMMNAGVFDRFPALVIQFAHHAGGLGRYLSRARGFAERERWGTAAVPGHNRRPAKPYDHYIRERIFVDCAGWVGPKNSAAQGIEWIKFGLLEFPSSQTVFATDYPQAIRDDEEVAAYTDAVRALGKDGATILSANVAKLLPRLAKAK